MNMTQIIFQLKNANLIKVSMLAAITLLTTSFSVHAEECTMKNSTIVVTATGESQATPDMAIINLSIVTHDKTAQKALVDNNKFMNNVVDSFKKITFKNTTYKHQICLFISLAQINSKNKKIAKTSMKFPIL